jgi:hypothetical protein
MMCRDVFRRPRPMPRVCLIVALMCGAAMPAEALASRGDTAAGELLRQSR